MTHTPTMDDAIAAGTGTLHGAIDYWQERAMLAEKQRDDLLAALDNLQQMSEEPPESNCSCHINPPCADCVNYSCIRDALDIARKAIAKVNVK